MFRRLVIGMACLLSWSVVADADAQTPSGHVSITHPSGSSPITITTTDRLAGAIHSLTWGGKEYIDSHDHGRQLQSAASFDCASSNEFWAECFNPTEAGSRADGAGERSSSKLLRISSNGSQLQTTSQMAFWLAPGEKSVGRPALNDQVMSEHLVSKRVHIGYKNLASVIEYEVTFTVPKGETHHFAQFEALTGYMPAEFLRFWAFQTVSGELVKLDDGPGEQSCPVVFSDMDGSHAMGIFSPDQPSRGYESTGYGRFRFTEENVVKWNCVFRETNSKGIAAGERRFRLFVVVGTQEDVKRDLVSIVAEFAAPN